MVLLYLEYRTIEGWRLAEPRPRQYADDPANTASEKAARKGEQWQTIDPQHRRYHTTSVTRAP